MIRIIQRLAWLGLGTMALGYSAIAVAAGTPAIDLQGQEPVKWNQTSEIPNKPGKISGSLPPGWGDDSSWARVAATYEALEFEGTRFLRVNVSRVDGGAVQMSSLFPDAVAGKSYAITLSVRAARAMTFAVQIRQNGPPYRQYWWDQVRAGGTGFEEITLETTALPEMVDPKMLLVFSSAGTVDIRSLSVAPVNAAADPGKLPPNLLRVSRFPLGPQTGMSLYREVSDETAVFGADPLVTGPSGVATLRVDSGTNRKFHFDSMLIDYAARGTPHTASIWVRGDGEFTLSAMSVLGNTAQVEKEKCTVIRPDAGWQRVVMPFVPSSRSRNHFLRHHIRGSLWLDAAMVSAGNEVRDYVGQGTSEVALAVPSGEASLAGIQFADEAALVRWAVSGSIEGHEMRSRVVSATGASADLESVRFGPGFQQMGELDFGKISSEPLGAFRIEAAVFDVSGKQSSPWAETTVLRVLKPRFWGVDAPQSAFGQHIRPTKRFLVMAKALGNNWARLHNDGAHITDWASLEPKPGEWNWDDAALQRYQSANLSVLGQFSTAPKWASYLADTGIESDGGYFGKYFLPKDDEKFANYVSTLASRYKGRIQAYEIWNEPWQVKWFGVGYVEEDGRRKIVTVPNPQQRYAELCKIAWQAAKEVDPSITIVGLNSTSSEANPGPDGHMDGTSWTEGFLRAGGLRHSDVASFHHYSGDTNGFPGDTAARAVHTSVGPNDRFPRIDKTVWMTEGSSTVGGRLRFGLYKHTLPYNNAEDPATLAESVLRYDLSMLANGVRKIFLYSMGDFEQGTAGSYRSGVTLDGSAHPAALGRASLAWHVDGLRFVESTEIGSRLHAYFFEGEGRASAVVAPLADHAPFVLPAAPGLEYRDIWMNPVSPGTALAGSTILVSFTGNAADLRQALQSLP